MDIEKKIKDYWEDPDTRSLIDVNLRSIESGIVKLYLKPEMEIIDIGCGDGSSTFEYGSYVKRCLGIERSNHLLRRAQEDLAKKGRPNITFDGGDIMDLSRFSEMFDLAITQRVLINLTSWELQKEAIENVRSVLKPGGLYVMIENTYEGHNSLNDFRASVGLKEISIHWHNLYFHHADLIDFLSTRFTLIRHHTFDLYYFLTRVYMNMIASFEGFGKNAVKDPVFDVADPMARRLYECVGDSIKVGKGPSFGPIQAFVLKKK